jgi:hypothetical protein
MSREGRGADQPPLFGPGGRIPAAQAVALTRQPSMKALREGWLPRHTVAMVALSPLLFLVYNAALGVGFGDPVWSVLIGAMAVVAALILATYLPRRGAQRVHGSSCAVMAGLLVPGAAVLLHQGTGPLSGALALAILSLGLWQRISGTSTCG